MGSSSSAVTHTGRSRRRRGSVLTEPTIGSNDSKQWLLRPVNQRMDHPVKADVSGFEWRLAVSGVG